jgi:hypothetical protein
MADDNDLFFTFITLRAIVVDFYSLNKIIIFPTSNLARISTHVVYVDIQGYKRLSRMEGDIVLRTFFKLGFMRMNFVGKFALDIHFLTVGSMALQVTGAITSLTLKALPGSCFAVNLDSKHAPDGAEPAFGTGAFSSTSYANTQMSYGNNTQQMSGGSTQVTGTAAANGGSTSAAAVASEHDGDDETTHASKLEGAMTRAAASKTATGTATTTTSTPVTNTRHDREKRDMILKQEMRYEWSKQQMELAPSSRHRSLWFKKGITTSKLSGDTAQMLAHMVDDFMEEASLANVNTVTLTFKTAAVLLTRENQAYSLIECLYLAAYNLRPLIRAMCAPYPWLDERIRGLQQDLEILAPTKSE